MFQSRAENQERTAKDALKTAAVRLELWEASPGVPPDPSNTSVRSENQRAGAPP